MHEEIRIIGKIRNKKYLLFYLTMYGSGEHKEIIYGIPKVKFTRHNSGVINLDFENKSAVYDVNKYFKERGIKLELMKLSAFKGIEGFGTLVPINDCKKLLEELNKELPYNKKRKKGYYYLNLN